MDNFFLLVALLSFLAIPVCLLLAIINFFKKKKVKPLMVSCVILFILSIICFIGFGFTYSEEPKTAQEIVNEPTPSAMPETTILAETTPAETTAIETTEAETAEVITTAVETTAPFSYKDIFIESLTSNPDVTKDAASSAYDILTNDLGFEELSVKKNPSGTIFEVKADKYQLKVTISDKLYMVICGDYNLYRDDTIKYTKKDLDDRNIGDNRSTYYTIAMEAVSQNLKSPSSAKFCSMNDCSMAKKGDYVAVKGYVDAINSFNAQVRSQFVVEFKIIDLSTFSYETVYLNIDGESVGEYIDLK